ncbi:hypothetical protein PVAND_004221 [Polypedilum vanderplanki]|uniref:Endonuclease/exonuclease/phosphatase domain-containing protein n=1 Tax=Polypedilum vanderplanki TaxID=319348 RepID=A0A9J6BWC3_POLVA|nr:hypothetical protein PVAND_004221 [Polypedilum vanderplanki]
MTTDMEFDNVHPAQDFKKQKTTQFAIPIHNTYASLNTDDDGQPIEKILTKGYKTSNPNTQKPPPINLIGATIQQVDNIFKHINKTDYEMKLTSEGIRLFTKTISTFKEVRELLIANELQYYTHQLRDEQMTKMVLHGLPDADIETVTTAITQAQLTPAMVKKMQIKNKKYDGHAVYLVYFMKKDKIRLNDLIEKHRIVSCIRVKWEHYKNPSKGPTQCRNCQRYGHGSNNCSATSRCVRCASNHKSGDCPLIKNETGKVIIKRIENSALRCVLCGLNHAASSKDCNKRREFINSKKQINKPTPKSRNSGRYNTENRTFQPAPELNDFNFPRLPQKSFERTTKAAPPIQDIPPKESNADLVDDILYWNCNGIQNKIHELYLYANKNFIHVICLNETFLKNNVKLAHDPEYVIYRLDRAEQNKGGVAILVRKNLKHQILPILQTEIIENVGITIPLTNGTNVNIFSVYLPGGSTNSDINNKFANDIQIMMQSRENSFFCGDLNSKHRYWNCCIANRAGTILYSEYCSKYFNIDYPQEHTHYPTDTNKRASTIDLVLSNNPYDINPSICNELMSDHTAVTFNIKLQNSAHGIEKRQTLDYSNANWHKYRKTLSEALSELNNQAVETTDDIDLHTHRKKINILVLKFCLNKI